MVKASTIIEGQDPYVTPFREIDYNAGYYLNVEYLVDQAVQIRAMHYDNRADPTILKDGQYSWTTEFNHIGLQATLPAEIGLIAQWMDGTTVMGPDIGGGIHPVDVEYDSYFVLLTRAFDRHRIGVRYDKFNITQNDQTREDNNPENGHAWTLSYRFSPIDIADFAVEWLRIKTHRCAYEYYDLDTDVTESQFQLTARLKFGKH